MSVHLSPRLSLMLKQGIDGEDFWDVCCDHGYLGEAALAEGRFARVFFVDRVPHIISKLKERLEDPDNSGFFAVSAEEMSQVLTGTVVIAGVGGFNLIKILEQWGQKDLLRAKRLVLNPLTHTKELRDFLEVWPLYIMKEIFLVPEGSRERQILVLERHTAHDKLPVS